MLGVILPFPLCLLVFIRDLPRGSMTKNGVDTQGGRGSTFSQKGSMPFVGGPRRFGFRSGVLPLAVQPNCAPFRPLGQPGQAVRSPPVAGDVVSVMILSVTSKLFFSATR